MKLPFSSDYVAAKIGAGLFAAALLFAVNLSAQVKPTEHAALPNLDGRVRAELSSADVQNRKNALANLQGKVAGLSVSFDALLDTPKFIRARTGFLTGTNGQGGGVSEQTAAVYAPTDAFRSVKAFLDDHAGLFGHDGAALQEATTTRDSVGTHNGLRTVVWQQQLDGLPVFESVLIGNITTKGELANLAGGFVPNAGLAADTGTPNRATLQAQPGVSVAAAIVAAAQNLGDTLAPGSVSLVGNVPSSNGFQKYQAGPAEAYARQVWLPLNRGNLRLCWELVVRSQVMRSRYQMVVDAETGQVHLRRSLTRHISDATYNVYTSDSPSPFSPGHQTPAVVQPPTVNRTLVTFPALDVTASPNGWINDGDNETRGNNTDTFVDRDFDGQPDGGTRTQGNPNRVFDYPLDLAQAPLTYSNAATVQMFYWVNWYHDRLYQLGFTESAGNYQADNFGRGGFGGDEIISYVQAAADLGAANNAFFSPAPDGLSGEIAMFVWDFPTPDRDGDLDAEIIIHEATHGTSWRLVGGGVGLGNLQSDGMGEGWSDFYALALLSQPGDDPDAAYAMGGYVTYQFVGMAQNYYFGVRHFPYSTDLTKNPFTFKDIDPGQISSHPGVPRSPIYPFNAFEADEVHHQGEVWCVALWEVRANLVRKYGASANELMLQLVTDGMKLSPANPNFLEARDAILLADQVNNGGANYLEIWRGFAKRGMGYSATSPASTTTAGVREAFDLPGLQIAEVFVSGGNGNGAIDFNECNDLSLVLTNLTLAGISNVQVTLSTTTPGVAFGLRNAPYPDMPSGSGGTNLVPFTMSTAPFFICGTPIELTVLIKSDQVTSTTTFTLNTGAVGTPERFDNPSPAFIQDNYAPGTNSIITVSNIVSAINKVSVSIYLTHTFDSDLYFELVGPDGTRVMLSDHNGGAGDNFGAGCSPEQFRTTFDDAAGASVTGAAPPFVGVFRPQQPLAAFVGKSGTNVNGNWTLHIVDDVGLDVGTLQCWSLFVSSATCVDGGGTCPGAELGIGMTDSPDPVFIGSNLVYTISITNSGPSEAKNVVINHLLPPSVVFASAFSSQGSVTHSGGSVVANIGTLPFTGQATVTVNVIPTLAGIINSTASVSANDADPDTSNNSVSVTTKVNPPASDIAVGIFDSPDPSLVGGTLVYTVSVTNNGPSTASGVLVTNTLPISAVIQSALASQGSASINGNQVVFNFGTLANTGRATGTISVTPTATGTLIATAVARANQADPLPSNNSATASTSVGPSADLALTLTDAPDPVVVNSNWVYTITVTNHGPSVASGVVVNHSLPAGVNVVTTSTSSGSVVVGGNNVTVNLASLANGSGAVVTVTVNAPSVGTYNSSASVTASEVDANAANNTASASTFVSTPFVSIVAAGATLTAESVTPADGAVSVGETVTVQLRLRNAGNVNNTNLTATLLVTNGVTAPVPATAVTYGVLPAGGLPVAQSFTFTGSGTNGGNIFATLQLRDNGNLLTNVAFNFTLPTVRTFANTNYIAITANQPAPWSNGPASPYPSTITVSGVTGLVGKVTLTLSNLSHTYPDDIDMLLIGPGGQKVILMSDAGGFNAVTNLNVTFDDAVGALSDNGQILSTSYHPTDFEPGDAFNAPAPAGPYSTSLSVFAGADANGTWSLYIMDDATGDPGSIAKGWSLALIAIAPVNQLADLGLAAAATPDPIRVGDALSCTFTVNNSGPNTATSVALSNVVPASATLLSATSSQGTVSTNGNTAVANLGNLNAGASATLTVVIKPGLGTLTNSTSGIVINPATVSTADTDLNPANNTASAVALVHLPVADVTVTQTVATNLITLNSNVVFGVSVTNQGPQTALGVVVTDPLPAGFSFVSTTAGSFTNTSGIITLGLGDLAAGASSSFTLTATATTAGARTNTVSVSTSSSDTNSANNTSALSLNVVAPAPSIIASGALITSESAVFNGSVDLGETATVSLSLQNVGTANTVNLRATLLSTGGVGSPSGAQSYGVLTSGGGAVARSFTFTAPNLSGGVVVATLALKDETPSVTNDLGTVTFLFVLPGTTSFTNAASITIPESGPATPYPSTISVNGVTGVVNQVTVTLNNFAHGFPDDVDVLLVSPSGHKLLLLSDAGGGHAITNRTVTFADGNAPLPDATIINSGNYQPTDYEDTLDSFPSPAPGGAVATTFATFKGENPNGDWSLYVVDDATGDGGVIGGGWSLSVSTINPINPVADLLVSVAATVDPGTPNPPFVGSALIYAIGVTNNGPATATAVSVTDNLPAGLSYVSSSASQGGVVNNSGVVTWTVGALSAGSGAGATIRVATLTGGPAVNTASVAGSETDLNTANNTAQLTTNVRVPLRAGLSEVTVTNAQLQFTLIGDAGLSYKIMASTNLTTWTALATNTAAANGTIKFTDVAAPGFSRRFYRAERLIP